jgi:hypothetical protein
MGRQNAGLSFNRYGQIFGVRRQGRRPACGAPLAFTFKSNGKNGDVRTFGKSPALSQFIPQFQT